MELENQLAYLCVPLKKTVLEKSHLTEIKTAEKLNNHKFKNGKKIFLKIFAKKLDNVKIAVTFAARKNFEQRSLKYRQETTSKVIQESSKSQLFYKTN